MLGLIESIVFIIIGAIIYAIGRYVPILDIANRILMVIGLIVLIIGIGFLIYNIVVGVVL